MATFERYLIEDKETHREVKNAYYTLLERKETAELILKEFGLEATAHVLSTVMFRFIKKRGKARSNVKEKF